MAATATSAHTGVARLDIGRARIQRAAPASRRLPAIDVVRGVFMVVIIASHVANNLDTSEASHAFADAFRLFFMAGTVGFTVISGALLGSFVATRPDLGPILSRYRQQGLRLLLVAHPLIALALYLPLRTSGVGFWQSLVGRHYVTDALAVFFIAVAPLVPRLSPRARLITGVACMAVARAWVASDLFATGDARLLREILVGAEGLGGPRVLVDNYPVLSLLGMFLIGTYVGDFIGARRNGGRLEQARSGLLRAAVHLPLIGLVLVGVWAILKLVTSAAEPAAGTEPSPVLAAAEAVRHALYPTRDASLFPFYLAFALALLGLSIGQSSDGEELRPAERVFELFGKTSLFTYVLQYALAQTIPTLLGLQGRMSVPFVLTWTALALAVAYAAASAWNTHVKKA